MEQLNHQELVSVIRGWHQFLRRQVKTGEHEDDLLIWERCCEDSEQMERYAKAMHCLATTYWETNNEQTRIDWCYSFSKEYFHEGGYEKLLEKSRKLHEKKQVPLCESISTSGPLLLHPSDKVLLLDVGSCYNPFHKYKDVISVGIDLNPATENVRKCDFLKIGVGPKLMANLPQYIEELPNVIKSLPAEAFHVIVFSLLLEYLPMAKQRWTCCVKACDLLAPNGVLLVVSPDSKHQNYNAAMVKSWRKALEHLGLRRIRYTKETHLHCMAFMKHECSCVVTYKDLCGNTNDSSVESNATKQATSWKCSCSAETIAGMMFIPQDFHDFSEADEVNETKCRTENEELDVRDWFSELPDNY